MKIKIQIKSNKYNGEIYLNPAFIPLFGSWEQNLNPQVTSTNDEYLDYKFVLYGLTLSLGEKMGDMPREELMVLSDFEFFKTGKTGKGFKRAHKYSSGQQLDADVPLEWKHLGVF